MPPLQPFSSTLEDVYVANIETDRGTREKIRFYDTQGLDVDYKDAAIPKHLLAAADGFLIVYSVDDWKSYQVAETIRKEIRRDVEKKEVVVVVLGTKVDLANSRQVEAVQAEASLACVTVKSVTESVTLLVTRVTWSGDTGDT